MTANEESTEALANMPAKCAFARPCDEDAGTRDMAWGKEKRKVGLQVFNFLIVLAPASQA